MSRETRRGIGARLAGSLLLLALPMVSGAEMSVDEADALVHAQWFEGMSEASIDTLSEAAVEHLAGVLEDPERVAEHANALELLGRAGGSGSGDVLLAYGAVPPSGAVSSAAYRAHVAWRFALGHAARRDPRALDALAALLDAQGEDPGWHAPRWQGSRLAGVLERSALTGLALSGRPEARAVLQAVAATPPLSPAVPAAARSRSLERRQHAADVLDLHAASANEGASR